MNLENVCRTCLRVPQNPKMLFEDKTELVKKIEALSAVVIEETEELPKHICEECVQNINNYYNFRKVIINTDLDLRTRLNTLKATKYTFKPRSKMKHCEIVTDFFEDSVDIKPEEDMEFAEDDIKIVDHDLEKSIDANDSEYMPKQDLDMLKDLATKRIFKCRQCKKIFDSKFKLYNHRRTEHQTPGVCNICGAVVRADNLSKHIKLHSETPVTCKECGKTVKNSESLRSHKLLHSENSFTCEICGRNFKLKGEHTRHLRRHGDPDFRKVACLLCGKKVHELKKHMLTHTGQRPYSCENCQKGFTSRYALKIHKRQHTNERPYICNHCGNGFPQKVSLLTHLKSKHCIVI
ncbi:hypothetical protein HUJ04_009687 [Dendroctonus ponderosae]